MTSRDAAGRLPQTQLATPTFDRERLSIGLDALHESVLRFVGPDAELRVALADAEEVIRATQAAILSGAMDGRTMRRLQVEFVPELTRVLARIGGLKR